ncbi:hypothetical protein PC116_g13162 [Phytophthora cactorum]|uniref:Uncharacterized protein n=1 Tax=Phytophthora cactorum TaxID=29920 RepID=A0A8T1KUN7_9STRA|nr:hypothetical protein Pcac1_g11380 [Phytophthora cactorum]KAG2908184.1 hypothetical protein PC114_g10560 [Phytophthora cactorum]KAG2982976.1 hypothetical protein PC118_g9694 [Phytophthora cactorum]KAG4238835.1 hypothetical protein PC116_g13162 [Phytophthora cactorum]
MLRRAFGLSACELSILLLFRPCGSIDRFPAAVVSVPPLSALLKVSSVHAVRFVCTSCNPSPETEGRWPPNWMQCRCLCAANRPDWGLEYLVECSGDRQFEYVQLIKTS